MTCVIYTDKNIWKADAIKKFKSLTMRKTAVNIMLYKDKKLVAIFNLTKNEGIII